MAKQMNSWQAVERLERCGWKVDTYKLTLTQPLSKTQVGSGRRLVSGGLKCLSAMDCLKNHHNFTHRRSGK